MRSRSKDLLRERRGTARRTIGQMGDGNGGPRCYRQRRDEADTRTAGRKDGGGEGGEGRASPGVWIQREVCGDTHGDECGPASAVVSLCRLYALPHVRPLEYLSPSSVVI